MNKMKITWTAAAIRGLGVRTTVPIAGAILAGLSETQSYELAKRGGFPVPVVKVGRRLVVPTAPILRILGLDSPDLAAAADEAVPHIRAVTIRTYPTSPSDETGGPAMAQHTKTTGCREGGRLTSREAAPAKAASLRSVRGRRAPRPR